MLTLQLPLKVSWSSRTIKGEQIVSLTPLEGVKYNSFILNLNNYRNAHHSVLHQSKIAYHHTVKNILDGIPEAKGMFIGKQVTISFKYWHHNKSRLDVSNPVAIIEKFACDALVEYGVISDDNYEVITASEGWIFMGVDKEKYPLGICELIVKEKVI